MKKVMAINGSARKNSNTATLLKRALVPPGVFTPGGTRGGSFYQSGN